MSCKELKECSTGPHIGSWPVPHVWKSGLTIMAVLYFNVWMLQRRCWKNHWLQEEEGWVTPSHILNVEDKMYILPSHGWVPIKLEMPLKLTFFSLYFFSFVHKEQSWVPLQHDISFPFLLTLSVLPSFIHTYFIDRNNIKKSSSALSAFFISHKLMARVLRRTDMWRKYFTCNLSKEDAVGEMRLYDFQICLFNKIRLKKEELFWTKLLVVCDAADNKKFSGFKILKMM